MRRDFVIDKSFSYENSDSPLGVQSFNSLTLMAQVHNPPFNSARFEFVVDGEELRDFLKKAESDGTTYTDLVQKKITELLQLDTVPVDAFVIEENTRKLKEAEARADQAEAKADAAFTMAINNILG